MKTLEELRKESNGKTKLIYHSGYWDGPLNGLMLWNGEKCWFEMFEEKYEPGYVMNDEEWDEHKKWCDKNDIEYDDADRTDIDRFRTFKVYRLPADVLEAIEYNHNLFRQYVGTHTDYDENGKRGRGADLSVAINGTGDIGDLKPYSEHGKWYDHSENRKPYKLELDKYEIMGEFIY